MEAPEQGGDPDLMKARELHERAMARTPMSNEIQTDGGLHGVPPVAPVTGSVIWLPGWYASRLHAVPSTSRLPEHRLDTVTAICGQQVYKEAQTEWAKRYLERGVPHCKRCERKISPNDKRSDGFEPFTAAHGSGATQDLP